MFLSYSSRAVRCVTRVAARIRTSAAIGFSMPAPEESALSISPDGTSR